MFRHLIIYTFSLALILKPSSDETELAFAYEGMDIGLLLNVTENLAVVDQTCYFKPETAPLATIAYPTFGPPNSKSFFFSNEIIAPDSICTETLGTFDVKTSIPDSDIFRKLLFFGDGVEVDLKNVQNGIFHSYSSPGTYILEAEIQTISSGSVKFNKKINVFNRPTANRVSTIKHCTNGVSYSLDLTTLDPQVLMAQSTKDYTITYYSSRADAIAGNNPLTTITTFSIGQTKVHTRIENKMGGCYDTTDFDVLVATRPVAGSVPDWTVCTASGSAHDFDLSLKDPDVLNGLSPMDHTVDYYTSEDNAINMIEPVTKRYSLPIDSKQTIYARIYSTTLNSCFSIVSFSIVVNYMPSMGLDETYYKCGDAPLFLEVLSNYDDYKWQDSDGEVIGVFSEQKIFEKGQYSLTVSKSVNGAVCTKSSFFEVVSKNVPDNFKILVNDTEPFSDYVNLSIDVSKARHFIYSIDGNNFKSTSNFRVLPGIYTVYISDSLSCKIVKRKVLAVKYPKHFSPNRDGIQNTWNIQKRERFPNARLFIYDRYGRLLKEIHGEHDGWDGTYSGNDLTSATYWFKLQDSSGLYHTGYFALKR